MMREGVVCLLLIGCAVGAPRAWAQAPRSVASLEIPPGRRQLFLDDFILGNLYRVERRIHQPTKHGPPLVQAAHPWEKSKGPPWAPNSTTELIELWSPPSWDPEEKVWKIWYSASEHRTAFARSANGIHWEKPELDKRGFQGSRQNNLVAVHGEPEAYIQHTLLDPDASPEFRYKGLTGYRDRRPLVSSDGYEFSLLEVPPIPSQDQSGPVSSDLRHCGEAVHRHRQASRAFRSLGLPVPE